MSKYLDDKIATSLNQSLHMKVCCFRLKTDKNNIRFRNRGVLISIIGSLVLSGTSPPCIAARSL
ncbi:MAG TPA: hypothetical protein DCM07_28535 [Planctomycetaceae bacterium]|nr:hypothetical protein [Planctomycetaceae bacterium]